MTKKCDAAFKQTVLLRCYDALARSGFQRRRKENVEWPLYDGFYGWVGLNTGLCADHLSINPFVGIHAIPIEKMWRDLEGKSYPGRYGPSATYAVHMGELDDASDQPAFAFTPWQSESFVSSEIDRLALLYASIGIEYARSISDYQTLLPLMMKRASTLGGYPQRVACCLYFMGRKADAKRFLEELPSDDKESLDGFVRPFLARLKHEGTHEA